MKYVKTLLITVFCAAVILTAGYVGIVFSGRFFLNHSREPVLVNLSGNISKLFYSKLEDDIQLFPWNYYPQKEPTVLEKEKLLYFFNGDVSYIENNVFYSLIAIAANVNMKEVTNWYQQQQKTIIESMVMGGTESLNVLFYEDMATFNGKDFQIKISCTQMGILSFSCIENRDVSVKDSEQWETQKDAFLTSIKEEPEAVDVAFGLMNSSYQYNEMMGNTDWYYYVELYQKFTQKLSSGEEASVTEESGAENLNIVYDLSAEVAADSALQVVELKDCIILLREDEITMGLYYDVLSQRLVGFHYFFK